MKARRRLLILAICVVILLAVIGALVWLRKQAPPEAARLLPEADAVVYIDFATIRTLTSFDQQPMPRLATGYEQFVHDTGFSFERDLDEAAMAVHRGSAHGSTRYTELLVGHYDQARLATYLRQRSRSLENYRDVEIYSVPIEDRTLRIALLAIDTVAVSNVDDDSVLHGIVDRFKKIALPFGGPLLVRTYYRDVPLGSLLWAVAHLPATSGWPNASSFTLPGGVDVSLPAASDVVVSFRMLTNIRARADFYTPSEQAARDFASQTQAFLSLFRAIQSNAIKGPADPDVQAVLDSISIQQKESRAELTATIPPAFLRKLVKEPAQDAVGGDSTAPPAKQ